jgi:hypothetical protein
MIGFKIIPFSIFSLRKFLTEIRNKPYFINLFINSYILKINLMERLLSKSQKKIIKKNPKLTNVCKDREK